MASLSSENKLFWILFSLFAGILVPPTAEVLANLIAGKGSLAQAFTKVYSFSASEGFGIFAGQILWNLLPFWILALFLVVMRRKQTTQLLQWVAICGVLGGFSVFLLAYVEAQHSIALRHWTAAALTTGFAPFFGVVGMLVGAVVGGIIGKGVRKTDRSA